MSELDSRIHSFIVRVWLEDLSKDAGHSHWRGHITHVPTGEKRYLRELGDIARFVEHCITNCDDDEIDAHSSRCN